MPFDTPQAAAAPTRRSSRHRTAAFEAPAAGATPDVATPAASLSRRAARQGLNTAGAPVAVVRPPAPEAPLDAFVQASLTFRAVAEEESAPAPASADVAAEQASVEQSAAEHIARRRPQFRKLVTLGATVGVMSLAGLLAVSMTMPAEAVAAAGSEGTASISLVASSATAADKGDERIQAFVTSSDVQNETIARAEDFSTVSLVDLASEQGIKFSDSVFTNDPDAAIQWPFLVGVSMSSGYGPRWGRMHEGIDFTPGEGAPIQSIADGTVRIATEQGGGYGVTVYIDHVIDGQVITSHYSHMQYGSLKVKAGDTVKVGDIVGLTGNTGHSFGAHLHFEIIVNGKTIDPLPWLRTNAGRSSLD